MFTTQHSNRNPRSVPAQPVLDHVNALMAAGYTPRVIARTARVETRYVTRILGNGSNQQVPHLVSFNVARPIMAIPIPDGMFVPALGTVRRLQALVRIGHPFDQIAYGIGLAYTGQDLAELALGRPEIVDAELADAMATVFDRWHALPGFDDDARELGRRHRFAAPLSWALDDEDDAGKIDDPTGKPVGVTGHATPRWDRVPADFCDVIADHRSLGHYDEEIAAALRISLNTLSRRLQRARLGERRRGSGDHYAIRPSYAARYSIHLPKLVAS